MFVGWLSVGSHLSHASYQGQARAEIDESSSEPSAGPGEDENEFEALSLASHDLYAGFIPQARKLYDMLGYAYELAPDQSARQQRLDEGGMEEELLRDIFVSSSSNVSEFVPRHLGDWNERFQCALEQMALLNDSNVSLNERIRVGRDLINLSQDFIHLSTMYFLFVLLFLN